MILNGIGASNGFAIGKVYKYEPVKVQVEKKQVDNIQDEITKLDNAIDISIKELEAIRIKAQEDIDEKSAEIFNAHIQILNDPEFIGNIKKNVKSDSINADYAIKEIADMFINMFEAMDNEYMKERAADIKDVSQRLLYHVLGINNNGATPIKEEVIVIANDLTPSDTAQFDKRYIKGFVTNVGGRTSHAAIMARTLEIPTVVGTKTALLDIKESDIIMVDGFDGKVHINPSNEQIEEAKAKIKMYKKKQAIWAQLKNTSTVTMDNHYVELVGNIGSPEDVEGVNNNGGEGIGLYRTEFLYMGRKNLPTEEEQFEAYKVVLNNMGDKPVVVRTLDIGGDKELPYMEMDKEMNPFLGNRAIRLCLSKKDIFKTQLRALLRASVYGNLRIMFPMIATMDEFHEAKDMLMESKCELIKEGSRVSDHIEIGIMIEIPAAAILADQFAKEVDFFSIGTNDLIQYTFAADRMNEKVSYLYQPFNPSLLRLIKMVINAAHKEGKWVGMCGEMAGEQLAIPILIGLGLDEFSMSATSILQARHIISKLNYNDMVKLASEVLQMTRDKDVYNRICGVLKEDV
ncbi:phosphoenolpyruvate--protein phosphotransferase [Vallitalea maricola]|uniref:Phosphoenolpyruvate--protein phosphotransferase n=1 Tax=Vallitalea maricola TaxID=3074433 RepID=A0ACB5UEN5_9FIRM|nr:phosphoenolpyruvate--protein phosphotransferase [Vallitalea sp. AN17-2]